MTNENPSSIDREQITRHALAAFKKLHNSRHYAADDSAVLSLVALATAYAEKGKEAGNKSLRPRRSDQQGFRAAGRRSVPGLGLTQAKPGPEKEPPKPWTDPVTDEPARNPYTRAESILESCAILRQRDPQLGKLPESGCPRDDLFVFG